MMKRSNQCEVSLRKAVGQVFFEVKIGTLNFSNLFNYVKGLGYYTPKTVLA